MEMCKLIYILLFSSPGLCQYAMNSGMKADLTFDDHNERFDVSNLMSQQNSMRSSVFDPQSSDEYRRMGKDKHRRKSLKKQIKYKNIARSREHLLQQIRKERTERLNRILNQALLKLHQSQRRSDANFAYHDLMESDGGNDDFNANLETFKGNVKENDRDRIISRRNLPVEDESILMNYAFPINVKIEGFLQTPVN